MKSHRRSSPLQIGLHDQDDITSSQGSMGAATFIKPATFSFSPIGPVSASSSYTAPVRPVSKVQSPRSGQSSSGQSSSCQSNGPVQQLPVQQLPVQWSSPKSGLCRRQDVRLSNACPRLRLPPVHSVSCPPPRPPRRYSVPRADIMLLPLVEPFPCLSFINSVQMNVLKTIIFN